MHRPLPAILPTCLVAAFAVCAAGCSVVLDPGEAQCETAADCVQRGPAFAGAVCEDQVCQKPPAPADPTWGCLGHVVAPTPDPTKMVTLTESLVLAIGKTPVTNVTVDVCDKLDVNCAAMTPGFPKGLTPDMNGNVTFTVAQGFDGFVRIMGPTIMDSRVYVGRPVITPPDVKAIELLQPTDYAAIAAAAKQTVDMTRGTGIFLAFDCQGLSGDGVSFQSTSTDSETAQFYLINQFPETPPAAKATDADGFGGFFNLLPGPAVAKSFRAAGDVYIGESSFNVLAYTISYVLVAPTPS
jgi:hypothetical protein